MISDERLREIADSAARRLIVGSIDDLPWWANDAFRAIAAEARDAALEEAAAATEQRTALHPASEHGKLCQRIAAAIRALKWAKP